MHIFLAIFPLSCVEFFWNTGVFLQNFALFIEKIAQKPAHGYFSDKP